MSLLQGLGVLQIGKGLAGAVCGRLFADIGADVCCVDPEMSTPLAAYLNHGKSVVANEAAARRNAIAAANLIIYEGRPQQPSRSAIRPRYICAGSMRARRSSTFRRSDRPGQRPTIRRLI